MIRVPVARWDARQRRAHRHLSEVAVALARFLACLQKSIRPTDRLPGPHNFFRAAHFETYDAETRKAIATVQGMINTELATEVWETALATIWYGGPVYGSETSPREIFKPTKLQRRRLARVINEVLDEHVRAV